MTQPKLEERKPVYTNSFGELDAQQFSENKTKREFKSFIRDWLGNKKNLKVLEVGCGSRSHVDLGKDPYLVGIDISEQQLKRNTDLQEKIVANIEEYQLQESEYDVIVAWWVLEHLSRPDLVLKNCQQALKPNGVLILASPNPRALKGLITKFSPQWFHVFVYSRIFGNSQAGINEQVPFRTYLRETMSPQYINKFAESNNLSVELFQMYQNYWQEALRKRYWLFDAVWTVGEKIIETVSFGYINVRHTDYRFLIRKV